MTDEQPEPFWSEGWGQEDLSEGHKKITVPDTHVNMISSTGQLLVKTGWAFEMGDIIKVCGIEALVTKREGAWDWPNHNFILTVETEQHDELRQVLTCSAEDSDYIEPPKYKKGVLS